MLLCCCDPKSEVSDTLKHSTIGDAPPGALPSNCVATYWSEQLGPVLELSAEAGCGLHLESSAYPTIQPLCVCVCVCVYVCVEAVFKH